MIQCGAVTRSGQRCSNAANKETGYCFSHDPAREVERKAARVLGGLHRRRSGPGAGALVVKVTDAASALELLNLAIAEAVALDNSPARCRVLIQAAEAAVKVIEIGEYEKRLAELERIAAQPQWTRGSNERR